MPSPSFDILWAALIAVSVVFIICAGFILTIVFGQRRYIKTQSENLAQLRQAEAKYRSVFENAVEGIFQIGPGGHFLNINPAFAHIFGFDSPEDLMASLEGAAGPLPKSGFRLQNLCSQVTQQASLSNYEMKSRRKDNKTIWICVNAHTVKDVANSASYFEGTVEDITERKIAEGIQRELSKRVLAAQEAERKRVAFELHDSVNQLLSSVRYRLKSDEESGGKRKKIDPKRTEECRVLVEKAIQELRRISRNLRPSSLDDLGLLAAIRTLCDEFSKRTAIAVHIESIKMTQRLAPNLELALFRIVQETLNNIEKHSQATEVELTLTRENSSVHATVTDNGKGFDLKKLENKKQPRGIGMASMKERSSFLGGTVSIDSAPGRGTKVFVSIPVKPDK